MPDAKTVWLYRKGLVRSGVVEALFKQSDGCLARQGYIGCKNHVTVDRQHKLVRSYHVSDAALLDSQAVDHLPMRRNTGMGVRADSACRSEEMEAKLRAGGLKSRVQRKGRRGKSLAEPGHHHATGKPDAPHRLARGAC